MTTCLIEGHAPAFEAKGWFIDRRGKLFYKRSRLAADAVPDSAAPAFFMVSRDRI
ncbi:hypothetical protein [Taibaiella helva]|uniref:hypothetical protein n=1 Tax=Taibaiella helva TaxID=2301235 RepID=UPI0013008D98|nr:hypothetical protein [Taibaiella helva]